MADDIIVRFHPREPYFPTITGNRVECSRCEYEIVYQGETYNAKEYEFSYEANGAIACCWSLFPESTLFGYHLGDSEKLTILDDKMGRHCYVFFKAHSTGEGMWLPYHECELNEHQELIVYIARGSHAFYPFSGIYWRIFGIANDLCENGREYKIVVTKTHEDHYNPPTSSITSLERFLIPLSLPCIRNRVNQG